MKRHRSLYPLSRDHHHALVEARNLSRAAETNDPTSLHQAAIAFALFWKSELRWHFLQEERIILPLLAKHKSTESHEYNETLKQHTEIGKLIDELNDGLTKSVQIEPRLLGELGETLRRHIRFEENELFPALELSATEEELWLMNDQLEQDRSARGFGACTLGPNPQATK